MVDPRAALAAGDRAAAVVDLTAIADNTALLRQRAAGAEVMVIVKADAYGHGLVPCAKAARAAGAGWLGVALLSEARTLRAAGDTGPVLAWLTTPGEDLAGAVAADIDLSVADEAGLSAVVAAAGQVGTPARIHLKIDTGLGRNGSPRAVWPALCAAAGRAQAGGTVEIVGVWTHLAFADSPGHPTIRTQIAAFDEAWQVAERMGLHPQLRHLANSAATLTLPAAHYDLVRPGIAVYGISPGGEVPDARSLGLRPAMALIARLSLVKNLPADHGLSYGHEYRTTTDTQVALLPLGYADGLPRHAGGSGPVLIDGRRCTIAGRVCMDQVVVDIGADARADAGDVAVLFGDPERGEPGVSDWAQAAATIDYEIVTRIGPRVPRRYLGGHTSGDPQ